MSAGNILRRLGTQPVWLVFLASSLLYLLCIASGVLWMDVGELSASAFLLGGAHPPGHPGYSLLGKLATFVPIAEVATRLSMLSALATGACLAGLTRLSLIVFPERRLLAILLVVPAAYSPALWINATRPEVYAACFALLSWAMVFAFEFLLGETQRARHALVAVLLLALAAGFHPAIALSVALPLALALLLRANRRSIRLAPLALGLTLLASLLYLYLPTRALAQHPPLLMWGQPKNVTDFFALVTASVYQDNFASSSIAERMAARYVLLSEGTGLSLLLAGYAGLLFGALTRLRGCFVLLVLAFVIPAAAALQSSFNPDMSAYLGMTYLPLSIGLGVLGVACSKLLPSGLFASEHAALTSALAIVPILVFALVVDPGESHERDRSDDAMQLWDETVSAMPPGPGIFFASGDPLLFVSQYEELVAGARPDIVIANPQLVRDRWFLDHLRSLLPAEDLYLPFLDDARKGDIAERLVQENSQRGRAVWGDAPVPASSDVLATRRAFQLLAQPAPAELVQASAEQPVPTPLAFRGYVGRRIAGSSAVRRAQFEATHGRFAAALQALGKEARFPASALQVAPSKPSLIPYLPRVSARFLYDDSQAQLLVDDIAWQLGLDTLELHGDAVEQQIHFAWRLLLSGRQEQAEAAIAAIGEAAVQSTAPMLLALGKLDLAEARLRTQLAVRPSDTAAMLMLASLLANRKEGPSQEEALTLFVRASELSPGDDEIWTRLGLLYAQTGRIEDARAAWRRALAINPQRPDVAAFLERAEAEAKAPAAP